MCINVGKTRECVYSDPPPSSEIRNQEECSQSPETQDAVDTSVQEPDTAILRESSGALVATHVPTLWPTSKAYQPPPLPAFQLRCIPEIDESFSGFPPLLISSALLSQTVDADDHDPFADDGDPLFYALSDLSLESLNLTL